MTKKRISPNSLVGGASALSKKRTWLKSLSSRDRAYVYEVAKALGDSPEASPLIVARRLKEELGAEVAESTIVRALKGILDAKR